MFEERMNKRAQEGLTLTTLLLIILGIVVVVVIVIGATKGFGFIFGKVDNLPGQSLQTAIASCNVAGKNDLRADYCLELKKVEMDGVDRYVTCNFLETQGLLTDKLSPECGDTMPDFVAFCTNEDLKDDVFVEDATCGDWKALG